VSTTTTIPAAGPETLNGEPLNEPTTSPPITPAMSPEINGAPDANAMPRDKGSAMRKTTTPEGKSDEKYSFNRMNVN
jgi:hypothetical protein